MFFRLPEEFQGIYNIIYKFSNSFSIRLYENNINNAKGLIPIFVDGTFLDILGIYLKKMWFGKLYFKLKYELPIRTNNERQRKSHLRKK